MKTRCKTSRNLFLSIKERVKDRNHIYAKYGELLTLIGKAGKGAGRMPWHWEPKKDVISCEKPWGGAHIP